MLNSTLTRIAICTAGGAVAAMTAAGPAMASETAASAPAKSTVNQPVAEQGGGHHHKGWVKKSTRVHERPSSRSDTIGYVRAGTVVHIKCKVKNRYTDAIWYKLGKRDGWVPAANIRTWDRIPHCRFHGTMEDFAADNTAVNDTAVNDFAVNDTAVDYTAVNNGAPVG